LLVPVEDLSQFELGIENRNGRVLGPQVRAAWDMIAATTQFSDTLLVTGESGSGKEYAAREYHDLGTHPDGPYVAVNCATIPEGVAERLLFGSRKGAFSGAGNAVGLIEAADGGTLFLDEIGELDLAVQGKLLRVLETRQVLRLGASMPEPVDIRLVLATHCDLRQAVEDGAFRADLFYRVARPEVRIPPLRERMEEIPLLIQHALGSLETESVIRTSFVESCMNREWPGNIRELLVEVRTAAQRAQLAGKSSINADDLDETAGMGFKKPLQPQQQVHPPKSEEHQQAGATPAPNKNSSRRLGPGAASVDKAELERTLTQEHGNVVRAARALGVHRTQLRRWIVRLGLNPRDFKGKKSPS